MLVGTDGGLKCWRKPTCLTWWMIEKQDKYIQLKSLMLVGTYVCDSVVESVRGNRNTQRKPTCPTWWPHDQLTFSTLFWVTKRHWHPILLCLLHYPPLTKRIAIVPWRHLISMYKSYFGSPSLSHLLIKNTWNKAILNCLCQSVQEIVN